jgi:hypothetical protein
MSGLLRRLSRRRPATADETGSPAPESSEPAEAPAETPAEPGGGQPVPAEQSAEQPVPDEQATQVLPAATEAPAEPVSPAPVRDLPAGIDPGELATAPAASASRGRLRRRLRYLRAVRDLLLRDLGGFMYEIHRSAGGAPQEPQRKLAESKARRIETVDAEVRALEAHLAEPHAGAVLREPGVGGLCPECGELHASDAQYCARCGAPLTGKARAKRDAAVAAAAQPATGAQPAAEPAPASVLWAGGTRPRTAPEPETEKEKTDPSAVTSKWLALPKKPEDAPATTRPAPKPAEGPAASDEVSEPAAGDEAAPASDAEAAGDEAPTTAHEPEAPTTAHEPEAPTTAHEPAAGDEPAAADDATTRLDAVGDAAPPPAKKPAEDFEPNGNRADEVLEPEPLGDPLSSRREDS